MGVLTKKSDRPFAVKLKALRGKRTQLEVATGAGLAIQTVYLLEQGRRHGPSLTTAKKLANFFGVSLDEIMT